MYIQIYRYIDHQHLGSSQDEKRVMETDKGVSGTHMELTSCPDDVTVWTGVGRQKRCSKREAMLL